MVAKPSPAARCMHSTPNVVARLGSLYRPAGGPVVHDVDTVAVLVHVTGTLNVDLGHGRTAARTTRASARTSSEKPLGIHQLLSFRGRSLNLPGPSAVPWPFLGRGRDRPGGGSFAIPVSMDATGLVGAYVVGTADGTGVAVIVRTHSVGNRIHRRPSRTECGSRRRACRGRRHRASVVQVERQRSEARTDEVAALVEGRRRLDAGDDLGLGDRPAGAVEVLADEQRARIGGTRPRSRRQQVAGSGEASGRTDDGEVLVVHRVVAPGAGEPTGDIRAQPDRSRCSSGRSGCNRSGRSRRRTAGSAR